LPELIILIILLILLFHPKILPGLGNSLGKKSRKPYRQAKWMWSLLSGTEDESIRAERDFGQECAREFIKQFPGTPPRADQELAAGIGAQLAAAVKDPRRDFRFTVIPSPVANAFALPGGFVFITGSLLELANHNRNEIAFFLAHEIGHILRGHAKDHLSANTFLNAIASRLPSAGLMLKEFLGKGYSQTLELEADQEAIQLVAAAGFDTRASTQALKRLAHVSPDGSGFAEYLSSHPPLSKRIHELEKSVGK
jgi:predicted Zn-dependent protease